MICFFFFFFYYSYVNCACVSLRLFLYSPVKACDFCDLSCAILLMMWDGEWSALCWVVWRRFDNYGTIILLCTVMPCGKRFLSSSSSSLRKSFATVLKCRFLSHSRMLCVSVIAWRGGDKTGLNCHIIWMSGGKSLNTLFTLNLICGFVFFLSASKSKVSPPLFQTHPHSHTLSSIFYLRIPSYPIPFCPLYFIRSVSIHSCNAHRNTPHFTDHNPQSLYCSTSNQSARVHNTRPPVTVIDNNEERATKQATSNSLWFTLKVVPICIQHYASSSLISVFSLRSIMSWHTMYAGMPL